MPWSFSSSAGSSATLPDAGGTATIPRGMHRDEISPKCRAVLALLIPRPSPRGGGRGRLGMVYRGAKSGGKGPVAVVPGNGGRSRFVACTVEPGATNPRGQPPRWGARAAPAAPAHADGSSRGGPDPGPAAECARSGGRPQSGDGCGIERRHGSTPSGASRISGGHLPKSGGRACVRCRGGPEGSGRGAGLQQRSGKGRPQGHRHLHRPVAGGAEPKARGRGTAPGYRTGSSSFTAPLPNRTDRRATSAGRVLQPGPGKS